MRGLLLLRLVISEGVSWESWSAELGLNLQVSCTANKWVVTKSQVLTAWWWKIRQVLSILKTFLVPELIQKGFCSVTSCIFFGQSHCRIPVCWESIFFHSLKNKYLIVSMFWEGLKCPVIRCKMCICLVNYNKGEMWFVWLLYAMHSFGLKWQNLSLISNRIHFVNVRLHEIKAKAMETN